MIYAELVNEFLKVNRSYLRRVSYSSASLYVGDIHPESKNKSKIEAFLTLHAIDYRWDTIFHGSGGDSGDRIVIDKSMLS